LERKPSETRHSAANPLTDIIRKGSVITIITLISRPIGYIREAIQAYLFGATLLVDAFIVAFNFPELIQTLFFSGATSAFLVPVCTKYLDNDEEYSKVYSTFINISIIATVIVSLIFFLFSSGVTRLIAPGFTPEASGVTRYLFVIMIPVITFHTLLSIMKAFLNAKEHFAAPEFSGVLWNCVFILSALTLHKKLGIYSLAVGAALGSALQILVQLPYIRRFRIRYKPVLSLSHPAVKEAKRLFTGALIATSIVPVNSFIGRVIASYLPHGEVASLAYAFRIFILPFSLFAVPVYTVMFSKLSKLYHEKQWQEIFAHVDSSIVLLCTTMIPSTVFLCTLGDDCVKILYQRGAFTLNDTLLSSKALSGYSIGLIFYALSISFVRIFNAAHDTRTPALVGLSSIVLNAVLAYLLMKPFKNFGIALATSAVSMYNFLFLFILFKNRTGYVLAHTTKYKIGKSVLAGFVLAILIGGTKLYLITDAYLSVITGIVLTALVYGFFFRDYFLEQLKRRLRR
jgi:putative peptidoglycan lipid II flippase